MKGWAYHFPNRIGMFFITALASIVLIAVQISIICGQTAVYRLHKENSSISGQFQLTTANPDGTSLAVQTADLKSSATGEKQIKSFDTQSGVPNTGGNISSGATVTFSLWMKKTANFGTMYPRAKLRLNNATGTSFCTATGTTALTTTLAKYTITCATAGVIAMTSSDRYYVWIGVNLTAGNSSNSFRAELDIEGVTAGNYDSTITVPVPVSPPTITSVSPNSAPIGTPITISGSGFGATQGTSTVKFNGIAATPTSWSPGSIIAPVPAGAATGNIVVAVQGFSSNGAAFTLTNAPPTASITAPSNNAVVASGQITINANAADSDGAVSKVEFFYGSTKIGSDNSSPFSFIWNNAASGNYLLTAKATDNEAATGTSAAINISVNNPPSVTLTAPQTETIINSGANIHLSASAADSDGTISKVEFYQGIVKLGESTAAPYGFDWNNVPGGDYVLTARSIDNHGMQTTSAPIYLTAEASGTISGQITRAVGGTSIAQALVKLSSNGALRATTLTTSGGNYSFNQVLIGNYTIEVSADGFQTQTSNAFAVNENSVTTTNLALPFFTGISYEYDRAGRLVAVTDIAGETAIYNYDDAGNLLSISRSNAGQIAITDVSPNSGSIGSVVTIKGKSFGMTPAENTVLFNGVQSAVLSAASTLITVQVPSGATTGPVTITSPAGTAVSNKPFTFLGAPTLSGFSPNIGKPGTVVTLNGSNFQPLPQANLVRFNATAANVTGSTPTSITTVVPGSAGSGKIFAGSNLNALSASSQDFYVPPSQYQVSDVDQTTIGRMAIGENKTISMNAAGKIALILFEGTANQDLKLNLNNVSIASSKVSIYRLSGTEMINGTVSNSGGTINIPKLPANGTYTILIDPDETFTGQMTLSLFSNTVLNNGIILNGPETQLNFTNAGVITEMTFSALAGQRLRLNINNSTVANSQLIIKTPDDVELANVSVSNRRKIIDILSIPATGIYKIRFQAGSPGSVSLKLVSAPVASVVEAAINTTVTSVITVSGQIPQISFFGNAGTNVAFSQSEDTTGGSNVSIKSPDNNEIINMSNGTTWRTLFKTGNYPTTVTPQTSAVGQVSVSFASESPSTTTTLALGNEQTVAGGAGQSIRLNYNGTAGQKVNLTAYYTTSSYIGFTFSMYAPDGTRLTIPEYAGDVISKNIIESIALPLTGRYQVLLEPFNNYAIIAKVLISDASDLSGTIAVNGSPATATVEGRNARFTFNGTSGQNIYINGNRTSGFGYGVFSLRNAEDNILSSFGLNYMSGTSGSTEPFTLTQNGVYSVVIDPDYRYSLSGSVSLKDVAPDVSGTIAIGGPTVPVNITAARQKARLTFAANAGQHIQLQLSGVSISNSKVTILRSDGSTLGNQPNGPQIGFANVDLNGAVVDAAKLPATDIYTIIVDPTGDNIGSMTLGLTEVSDITSILSAGGAAVPVNISNPYQNARLTFSASAGQHLKITIANVNLSSAYLTIYKPDGTPLTLGNGYSTIISLDSNTGISLPFIPVTGTYLAFVDPLDGNTGSLDLALSQITDWMGTTSPGGSAVPVTISSAGQNARLTFNASAGQHLSLRMSSVTVPSSYISIYAPNGASIGSLLSIGTSGGYFDIPLVPVAGTYTAIADMQENTGNMTFTLSAITDVVKTIISGGAPITVNITSARQNGRLNFSAAADEQVSLSLSGTTITSSKISIIKPDGTVISEPYNAGTSAAFIDKMKLPLTGNYVVLVDPVDTRTGNMTLTLHDTPDVVATVLPGGAVTPVTTYSPGQNVRLSMNGTTGQKVTVKIENDQARIITVKLLTPTGQGLTEVTGNGNVTLPYITLPATGNYTIVIDPNETSVGNMNIIVTNH